MVAFKSCRVSDYNGKTLNASSTPQDCVTDVKHRRCIELKKWYSVDESVLTKVESLSTGGQGGEQRPDNCVNLAEMIQDAENSPDLNEGGKSHWYKVSGYCTFYTSSDGNDRLLYYLACPVCKKKVTDEASGYRCENCAKSFGEAIPTYNFGFKLSDYSGSLSI